MNKKFLSAVLFGALMVSSTGTFVSCKDYDEDIDRIDKELVDIKSALSALQAKVDAGKYVTNVVKNGDGITVTWSDNSTSTIETIKGDKGEDGKNGTVVTIIDGYWAFDGVKSEYPAKGDKGDKGDQGEPGDAAAAGHDAKVNEETGYWQVWDAEKGAYVDTKYIAGGLRVVEVAGGYNFTVTEANGEPKTIFIPGGAALLSIIPELNGQNYAQDFDIYYGILNNDVDWAGHKAVNGKMLKGMYPTADRDIKMQVNPAGADADAYDWAFVSTDNTTPWGLNFGAPQAWTGKATTATRATSANGMWLLPRDVQKWDLDAAGSQGRPDYAGQFKANDGDKYLFALKATSKNNGEVVKSPFVYTFKASNVNATENIHINGLTFAPSGSSFLYGKEYTPSFDMLGFSSDGYDQEAEDSVLVYDYYLEIDKSKITDESIRKYGVEITADGYRFIAKKEAVVNNTIPFIYNYILINGQKGKTYFSVNFNDEAVTVPDKFLEDIVAPFNATVIADQTRWYGWSKALDLTEFFNTLGDAGKMKWIDAIARSMGNSTDPQEINRSVFDKRYGSNDLDFNVELTGGDPINNQGTWDRVIYNGALLDKYIEFDYVDATGKSCLTGNIRDLDKITALKVTFKVDSELGGHVTAPYYTTDGRQYSGDNTKIALPLDNAFRVEIATRYDQYEVARMNFSFELQMPTNCPIKRESVANRTSAWSKDKDGNDVLKVYGEKLLDRYDAVAADMRDAFKGVYNYQNGAYNAQANVEANWYEVLVPTNSFQIIGKTNESYATLADISNSSLYTEWNTIGFYGTAGNMDAYTLTDVKYHHFNVYTEAKDDIILQFASRIADSKVAKVASKGTKENPFIAKAVYSTDGLQTILKYAFEVSNTDFTLADAFDKPYYLFDRAAAQGVTAALRAELNSSLVNNRQSIVVDKADPSFYGLYPSAKMDQQATNVVTYILDGAAQTANTNKMKFDIAKEVGNGKVIEITYHITDVFGMTKDLTFYVQTLN